MILTIGMIVKNEEKWLDKCLLAIKPILDNVDSELIITDTGSTDKTIEIAQKYTDKILHFDWIKNFSAARNTALKIAQGEWFMFLDADEIFENCNEIIDFFNSGDYSRYRSASFVIRNLYGNNDYIDFYPRRMVTRLPDTHFVGIIHEYLYPINDPNKHLNSIALHYGYLYQTPEEAQYKFERNIELMLKILKTEDNPSPMLYSQLFDGYSSVFDYENANKYIEIGIETCKQRNDKFIIILFFQKAEHFYRNAMYDKTVAVCEDYFSEKERMRISEVTTDGDMYAYKADSLFALDRYEEAIKYYIKFFDIYKKIRSGRLCTEDIHQKTIEMCSERVLPGIFNNFLSCCTSAGKFNTADNYLRIFPIDKFPFNSDKLYRLVKLEIEIAKHFSYRNIYEYYRRLNEYGKNVFRTSLVKELFTTQNNTYVINALSEITKKEQNEVNNAALRAAEIIADSIKLRSEKQYKECISELKKSIKVYEPIAQTVSEYVNDVVDDFEKAKERTDSGNEMQRLALKVKNNIRAMIDSGKYEQAKKTLDEYRQINPKDTDIEEIEAMLRGK